MRRAFAIAALLAIGSCASTSSESAAKMNMLANNLLPPVTSPGLFGVQSERSPKAKDSKMLIAWTGAFSCISGITQLGDSKYASDRLLRLASELSAAFPNTPAGTPLIVRRYDIYFNRSEEDDQEAYRAGMAGIGLTAIEIVRDDPTKIWRRAKCDKEKQSVGWFDQADISDNSNPITVDLNVRVFDRDYSVNAAISSELDAPALTAIQIGAGQVPAHEALVQKAMTRANTRLVEMIKADGGAKSN